MMSLHLVVGFLDLKSCLMALAVGAGVLLGADDDGFWAVIFVDAIYHFIKSFHLADLFSSDIKEVLLDGAIGTDAHHNDTSPLKMYPLNEYPIQHLSSCLDDGNRGTGGGDESRLKSRLSLKNIIRWIIYYFLKQMSISIHFFTFALLHFCKLDFNVFRSAKVYSCIIFIIIYYK